MFIAIYFTINQCMMIRLNLKPSVIKNLNFNKKDKTLEIEFKHHINTAQHINIPLKVIKDYVEALKYDDILSEDSESFESYLKVVHSNFRN